MVTEVYSSPATGISTRGRKWQAYLLKLVKKNLLTNLEETLSFYVSLSQVRCVQLRIPPEPNLSQRQERISVESQPPACRQYGLHIEQV